MSYRKSRARVDYERKTRRLYESALKISYKKHTLSYELKGQIYQNTITSLSSCLEVYIKTFTEDLFYSYRSQNATLSEIPTNARLYGLLIAQQDIYREYLFKFDGEIKTIKKLLNSYTIYNILQDEAIFDTHLDIKDLINKKYPNSENIKVHYHRLGINNIWDKVQRKGKKNYKMYVDALQSIRTTLTHEDPIDLTFEDVKRHIHYIDDLVSKLDRVCFSHVCSISGIKFWPADENFVDTQDDDKTKQPEATY